jgi:hypothetical protein
MQGDNLPQKLESINQEMKELLVVLKSGGDVGVGGHARPGMAPKGLWNLSDTVPGRLWLVTGMGANRKTWSGLGSQGKPLKYGAPFLQNFTTRSPFMSSYVTGNVFNFSPVMLIPPNNSWYMN